MTVTGLRFETCWSFPYPYPTTGLGTALTMCLLGNDPGLAFLTQTDFADDVVYVHDVDGSEGARHATPLGQDTVTGFDYDRARRWIWACQGTVNEDLVIAFDPDTGALQQTLTLPVSATLPGPSAVACNGLYIVRGGGPTLEAWSMNGTLLGTRDYPGRGITGLSTSALGGFCFVDAYTDEIVVIGPLGNELAVSSGVGASGGMAAIAFDHLRLRDMDAFPQVWLGAGVIGDPGTKYHPDTPWDPDPWLGRHRLYVANELDQVIHAGYLTAE